MLGLEFWAQIIRRMDNETEHQVEAGLCIGDRRRERFNSMGWSVRIVIIMIIIMNRS